MTFSLSNLAYQAAALLVLNGAGTLAQSPPPAPTEREAQQLLTERATRESNGSLRLTGFRKTDGIRREIFGTPVYEFEFEAQVLVVRDLKWRTGGALSREFDGFKTVMTDAQASKEGGYWAGFYNLTQNSGLPYRAKTQVRVKGKLTYERSEKGWRLAGRVSMEPVDLSNVAKADDQVPPAQPAPATPPSPPSPSPPTSTRGDVAASLSEVVPAGTVGEFKHGTPVTACYSATKLVEIVLRGGKFSRTCARTRNLVHAGIDVAATKGTEIRAIAGGNVTDVIMSQGDRSWAQLGYAVIVKHSEDMGGMPTWSLYLHMDQPPRVSPGDEVRGGETVLGVVGATGSAFGDHVHIEVRHFPTRISARWNNIYGVEAPTSQGGTFDPAQFAADWMDPLSIIGSAVSEVTPSARAAGAATVSPADASAAEGMRLYAAGEYSEAAKRLQSAAAAGNARAAGFLGFMYKSGNGVMQDIPRAIELFKQSAEAGEPGSAYNLGDMFWEGEGTKRDRGAAELWYAKAFRAYSPRAESGDADAMTMIGRMHLEGRGTPENSASALAWLSKASDAGSLRATRMLGEMYLNGRGVKRNREEGLRFIRLAAQRGDQVAQEILRSRNERW